MHRTCTHLAAEQGFLGLRDFLFCRDLARPSAMASVADSVFSRFSPLQPAVFAAEVGTTA
jgi:hypothetical protein